ncbi:MAG TPA: cold shock domain-containing protein [Actinomycetota bacterium]|nr:cold shock domain-containing protein [Actinomycetota bacterium]
MPRGQVKWFDPKKGYGFIVGPEGQDVFVHYSHIQSEGFRTLKDGESVDYELLQGEKGWQARSVRSAEAGDGPVTRSTPGEQAAAPAPSGYHGAGDAQAAPRTSGYEGAGD